MSCFYVGCPYGIFDGPFASIKEARAAHPFDPKTISPEIYFIEERRGRGRVRIRHPLFI